MSATTDDADLKRSIEDRYAREDESVAPSTDQETEKLNITPTCGIVYTCF